MAKADLLYLHGSAVSHRQSLLYLIRQTPINGDRGNQIYKLLHFFYRPPIEREACAFCSVPVSNNDLIIIIIIHLNPFAFVLEIRKKHGSCDQGLKHVRVI